MGQGLAPNTPLPAPPQMPKSPSYTVPAGKGIGMESAVMGGGFGQGIVPNAPRPAAPEVKFAEFSIPLDSFPFSKSRKLQSPKSKHYARSTVSKTFTYS